MVEQSTKGYARPQRQSYLQRTLSPHVSQDMQAIILWCETCFCVRRGSARSQEKHSGKISSLISEFFTIQPLLHRNLSYVNVTLREKCPNTELFMVGIFRYSD